MPDASLALASILARSLTGKPRGILVNALAEAAFESGGERDAVLAELVAQPIHRGHRLAPAVGGFFLQHIELSAGSFEAGRMDAQQTDGRIGLAIRTEQGAHLLENLCIELGAVIEGMRASDGGEIGV